MTDFTLDEYASILSNDLLAFTEESFSLVSPGVDYMSNWHIECIVEHLLAVEEGEILRLIINMPPRALKSITVAITWPAWLLGQDPTRQIIAASYGADLSKRHSMDTRFIMESDIYGRAFPETVLANDQNEKSMFRTTKRGFRKATSVGGSILGDGGDFLIFDDLIKANEADSITAREKTNNWLRRDFLTRMNDPKYSRVVGVMQRLHEDDPSGTLMRDGGWHELVLPAQFYKKTFIEVRGKTWECEEGEYLHEERLGAEVLDQKMKDLGAYGYAGQYQQNPAPVGGGEFSQKHMQFYNNSAKNFTAVGMNIYIIYDPANTKKNKENSDPDYTAMMVVGLASDNNYYVLDMVRDRFNPTERINRLIDLHMKWNRITGKPPVVGSEQYGMMTDNFYLKKAQDTINYRFPVVEFKGTKVSKEDRIRRLIPLWESGRIYLPQTCFYSTIEGEQKELVEVFVEEELMTFPVGRHDDMLDCLGRVVEPELYAQFPKPNIIHLQAGESLADALDDMDGYNKNDFTSW